MAAKTASAAAPTPPRFLVDDSGSYDLAAVSAVQVHHSADKSAVLVLEGGQSIATKTEYAAATKAWQEFLTGEPVESATADESGSAGGSA